MAKVVIEFEIAGGEKVRTSNQAIIKQLDQLGIEYNKVEQDAENASKAQVEANEQVEKSYKDILKEYRENRQELQALAIAGEETSDRFKELSIAMGEAEGALEDARLEARANKGTFDAVGGSLNGVVGGFSAVTGALATFGLESEATEKAILKVQGALALTEGVDNLIKSRTAFITLGKTIKGPVLSALTSLKGAIIATGIGALAVGIGLLIANFDKVKKVVLNLFPSLEGFGKRITSIINTVTDFIGITDESERAADALVEQNNKIAATQEKALKIAKAAGVGEKELNDLEKKYAADRINRIKEQIKVRGEATEEETKELEELGEKIGILAAARTKTERDEAEKRVEDNKKALEKLKAAQDADAQRRVELIQDTGEEALAQLELEYQKEVTAAKENGEDIELVRQVYEQRRLKQIEENEKAVRDKLKEETEKTIKSITDTANLIALTSQKEYNDEIIAILDNNNLTYEEKEKEKLKVQQKYNILAIQDEIATIDELIKAGSLEVNAAEQYAAEKRALEAELKQLKIDNEQDVLEEKQENYSKDLEQFQAYIEGISNLLGSLGSIYSEFYNAQVQRTNEFYDEQLSNLEAYRDKELRRNTLTNEEKEKLELDFAKKSEKIERERNEELTKIQKEKADVDFVIQLAQIASNVALGLAQVNANPAVNLDVSQTLRAILSAIVIANGIAQTLAATNARNQVKSLGAGGILEGPSHSQGGIRVGDSDVYVEGDEAVINKRSTAMYKPLLSAINVAGGGVPLVPNMSGFMARGGQLMLSDSNVATTTTNNQELTSIKAYLVQSEVNSGIVRDSRIRRQSRF